MRPPGYGRIVLPIVGLRSQLEAEVRWRAVKGPDERPCGTPLTAPHLTTGGLCRWKAINKVGRHVGVDFYDLLIEGRIAFFIPGKLKKVNVSGGTVSDICSAGAFGMGGAWSSRGVIVLATFGAALKRVPESGGTPEAIPGAELLSDAIGHMWPTFSS
jgi:hypothetical protein